MSAPAALRPTDETRSLAAIERTIENAENALVTNGYTRNSAQSFIVMGAARVLARIAASAPDPASARAIIMHTLEEEFGKARPT